MIPYSDQSRLEEGYVSRLKPPLVILCSIPPTTFNQPRFNTPNFLHKLHLRQVLESSTQKSSSTSQTARSRHRDNPTNDELPPQHPRQGAGVGPRLAHLNFPSKRPNHPRRVRRRRRLPSLQVPDMVVGRRFSGKQARQLPASRQAVPCDSRRALPPQTRR